MHPGRHGGAGRGGARPDLAALRLVAAAGRRHPRLHPGRPRSAAAPRRSRSATCSGWPCSRSRSAGCTCSAIWVAAALIVFEVAVLRRCSGDRAEPGRPAALVAAGRGRCWVLVEFAYARIPFGRLRLDPDRVRRGRHAARRLAPAGRRRRRLLRRRPGRPADRLDRPGALATARRTGDGPRGRGPLVLPVAGVVVLAAAGFRRCGSTRSSRPRPRRAASTSASCRATSRAAASRPWAGPVRSPTTTCPRPST